MNDFHGGAHAPWARAGRPLGWYVAQYDGEIATVDAEIGTLVDALDASPVRDRTLVIEGVNSLNGATHRVMPDRIVAASLACAFGRA